MMAGSIIAAIMASQATMKLLSDMAVAEAERIPIESGAIGPLMVRGLICLAVTIDQAQPTPARPTRATGMARPNLPARAMPSPSVPTTRRGGVDVPCTGDPLMLVGGAITLL